MSHRAFRNLAIAFTIVWAGILLAWAIVTPGFRSPDAPAHFNSVLRVANGGGWPEPGTTRLDDSLLDAGKESGLIPENRTSLGMFGITVLNGGTIEGTGPGFWEIDPTDDYSVLDYGNVDYPAFDDQDQMTQHPGLYYYLAAGVLRAVGAMDWTWNGQYLLIAIFSSALMVPIMPLTFVTARLVGLSRLATLTTAFPIIALPQFAHIGASVSNDSLTFLASSATIAGSAYLMKHGFTWRSILTTGVSFGIASITKGTALPLVFTIIAAGILAVATSDLEGVGWRTTRFFSGMIPVGLVTIATGGWWWITNIINHGAIQPRGFAQNIYSWRDVTPTFPEWAEGASARLLKSTWGNFGWLEVEYPPVVWWGATILAFLLTVTGLLAAARLRPATRVPGWLAMVALLAGVAISLPVNSWVSWSNYVEYGTISGVQGRYLFVAVVAFAVAFGWACEWVIQRGHQPAIVAVLALAVLSAGAMASTGWYRFAVALYPNYAGPYPIDVVTWMAWSPLPGRLAVGATAVAGIIAVMTAIVFLAVAIRSGRRTDVPRRDL